PLGGEQFALIDAVEELRRVRRAASEPGEQWLALSAADPANLAALGGGSRVPAVTAHRIVFCNGRPVAARVAGRVEWLGDASAAERERALAALDARARPARLQNSKVARA